MLSPFRYWSIIGESMKGLVTNVCHWIDKLFLSVLVEENNHYPLPRWRGLHYMPHPPMSPMWLSKLRLHMGVIQQWPLRNQIAVTRRKSNLGYRFYCHLGWFVLWIYIVENVLLLQSATLWIWHSFSTGCPCCCRPLPISMLESDTELCWLPPSVADLFKLKYLNWWNTKSNDGCWYTKQACIIIYMRILVFMFLHVGNWCEVSTMSPLSILLLLASKGWWMQWGHGLW